MGFGIRWWAVVVLCGVTSGAAAQERPSGTAPVPPVFQLPAGARVRLASQTMPGGLVEGRVVSSTDDTVELVIGSDDSPFGGGKIVVPRASLTDLRVSLGYRRYAVPGLLVGLLVGAAGGAASKVDPNDCDVDSTAYCSRGEAIGFSAALGALVGGLVGHFVKTERWQKVSVEVLAPGASAHRSAHRGPGASFGAQVALRF